MAASLSYIVVAMYTQKYIDSKLPLSDPMKHASRDSHALPRAWTEPHSRREIQTTNHARRLELKSPIYHTSLALDMTESRLGRCWKAARRRCWCEDGLIRADKALFTKSPSTPQILTKEFVIADLRAFKRVLDEQLTAECELLTFL